MEKETLTYTKAIERIEQIVSKIESGEQDIDGLTDLLREARDLITFCHDKLYKVEHDVDEIFKDTTPTDTRN